MKIKEQAASNDRLAAYQSFLQGLLCNLLNPKAILFILAFFTLIENPSSSWMEQFGYAIEIANEPNITIAKLGHLLLLSPSNMSRIVSILIKDNLVQVSDGADKREKYLQITEEGRVELHHIDEFSSIKIKGALEFLTEQDQAQIIEAMQKYADALEKSRLCRANF